MKSRAQMSRAAPSDKRDHDESVVDNNDAEDHEDGSETTEDRAQTFRKRRLSLDNLRQTALDAEKQQLQQLHRTQNEGEVDEQEEDDDDDPFSFYKEPPPLGVLKGDDIPPPCPLPQENDKAQSFRKRRLSLTLAKQNGDDKDHDISEVVEPPPQRSRRLDDNSVLFSSSTVPSPPQPPPPPPPSQERVPSRTVHASDLLAHKPISTSSSNHVLYQQKNAPPQRPTLDTLIPPQDMPSWTQSAQHHQQEQEQEQHSLHNQQTSGRNSSNPLPFPTYVVGTYSCHGVEPIYDTYLYDEDANFHVTADEGDKEDPPHHVIQATPPPHGKNEKPPTTAAKINQDRGGVSFPYGNSPRTALFAVYDGHGQGGELVSQFASHEIQRRLEQHEKFLSDITQSFVDTFVQVNADLATEPYIEPLYAGTTACVGLLRNSQLICANVGDSRAVCARRKSVVDDPVNIAGISSAQYHAIPLTQDQNPDWAPELARIEQMGGFVSPPPEPGLSARVWLDPECKQIGLAMARSLGDYAVKDIGVIAEPIVTVHTIQPDDEFVIFATDGVWEFISSQEAVDVVGTHLSQYDDATKACQALMELAAERWHEEEGDYRDDITALIVRLPLLWKTETTAS